MENLLATPVRPVEVMVGKIVPYIIVGYIQVSIILLLARWLFGCRWWAASCCSRLC